MSGAREGKIISLLWFLAATAAAFSPPLQLRTRLISGTVEPNLSTFRPATTVCRGLPFELRMSAKVIIEKDEASVGKRLCRILEQEHAKAISEKDHFFFSISGGSMLKMLSHLQGKSSINWRKCTMGFVSHRAVPLDSDGATYHKARPAFLQSWMDQGLTVIKPTGGADALKEANAYEAALTAAGVRTNGAGLAVFDLLLIGVGNDGHVGSIYPLLPDVDSSRSVLAATSGTGKISMSLAAMAAARASVVACAGKSSKAPLGNPHNIHICVHTYR